MQPTDYEARVVSEGFEIWELPYGGKERMVAWFRHAADTDAYLEAMKAGLDFPNLVREGREIIDAQRMAV